MFASVASVVTALGPFAYVLIFLVATGEAAAMIGLVLPGDTTLLLVGYLGSRGEINIAIAIPVAVVGGVLGDSIGYEMGRRFGARLLSGRLGRLVGPDRWDRARGHVRRHGAMAVLIGRCVGVLRAVTPAVVGDARMPYGRFLVWNVLGAATWTPVVVFAGYLAGDSYDTLAQTLGNASIVLGTLTVLGWVLWRRLRRTGRAAPDQGRSTSAGPLRSSLESLTACAPSFPSKLQPRDAESSSLPSFAAPAETPTSEVDELGK